MNGIQLKAAWRAGQPTFGAWVTLADPAAAAFLSNVGFDWLYIDSEHNPFNPETLRNILLLLRDRGTAAIVRVGSVNEAEVKHVLDWGAEGVMFAFIRTAAEARRAVAACRYPPDGIRGFNPREASNFYQDLAAYLPEANARTVVILQIEHADAIANLDEILQTPGVDAVMIGPADLSYSLGVPLQTRHPSMQAAIDTVLQKALAAGVPVGMTWEDSDDGYLAFVRRGMTFISPYADSDFMTNAASAWLSQMRASTRAAPSA